MPPLTPQVLTLVPSGGSWLLCCCISAAGTQGYGRALEARVPTPSLIWTLGLSSPIGEVFRARLRQFPSLVNCSTIDWFNEWPTEALESVATMFLNEIPELEASVSVVEGLVGSSGMGKLLGRGRVMTAWFWGGGSGSSRPR